MSLAAGCANVIVLPWSSRWRRTAHGRQEPAANGSFIAAQLADRCASERTFGSSSPLPHGPNRIRFSAARTAAHPTPPVPGSRQRSSSTPRGADSEAHSLPCAQRPKEPSARPFAAREPRHRRRPGPRAGPRDPTRRAGCRCTVRTKLQRVKPTAKHLSSVQRRPERIKSYFQHAPVCSLSSTVRCRTNNGFFALASAQYRTELTRIDQVDTDRCDLCKWPADVTSISLNQRKPASPS